MTTGTRNLIGKLSDTSALFFQFLLNDFSNMYFVALHKKKRGIYFLLEHQGSHALHL